MDNLVRQYFESVPESRKGFLDSLHKIILEIFPEATVDMKYKMPTYQYKEGWVAIANQKNYISLYTCGYDHIKEFKNKYPEIKTGKGCINFLVKDVIPTDAIKRVIQHAILHPKGN